MTDDEGNLSLYKNSLRDGTILSLISNFMSNYIHRKVEFGVCKMCRIEA